MKQTINSIAPVIIAIILGIAGDLIYTLFFERWAEKNTPYSESIGEIILIVIIFIVVLVQAIITQIKIRELGVIKIHEQAEQTIATGLESANSCYYWLGTSAYYVLCDPKTREQQILPRPHASFIFITLDPECPSIIASQAEWSHTSVDETTDRINESRSKIKKLRNRGLDIVWEGRSTTPSFRVVIVNQKKVFVSFYEKGKKGPQCKQLELDAGGILGQWFLQYFENERADATRMRIERTLTRYLFSKANIEKLELLAALKRLCPEDENKNLEHVLLIGRQI